MENKIKTLPININNNDIKYLKLCEKLEQEFYHILFNDFKIALNKFNKK